MNLFYITQHSSAKSCKQLSPAIKLPDKILSGNNVGLQKNPSEKTPQLCNKQRKSANTISFKSLLICLFIQKMQ